MRVFLDADVPFTAACSPTGLSRGLFYVARKGHCTLATSPFAVEEARRNLFLKAPGRADGLDDLLKQVEVTPEPPPALVRRASEAPLVSKDAPILAAAIACRSDLLVTDDRRHFGHLYGKTIDGVSVVAPAEAFDRCTPLG